MLIHALKTVAARVASSDRLRRNFETVSPPREKERSASTEVAGKTEHISLENYADHRDNIPGVERMSRAIRASGLRSLSRLCQCWIGFAMLGMGGDMRYSSSASTAPEE